MKPGESWNVRGVRPETQETALEAARRSGLSIGDWLNSVIIDSAGEVRPKRRHDDERLDWKARRPRHHERLEGESAWSPDSRKGHGRENSARRQGAPDAFESLNQRLDGLTRQLDRLAKLDPSAAIPPRNGPGDETTRQFAAAISHLDSRLDQLIAEGRQATHEIERRVSAVDRAIATMQHDSARYQGDSDAKSPLEEAIAQITARQRELDAAPSRSRLPDAPAVETPRPQNHDFARFQKQLQQLTSRIEALRRPSGLEDAVAALRGDLAEIGRTLREAMPRRAVEALEAEVRRLAERLLETRHAGADAKSLMGIEQGLAEVRDALRTLTPAESLVGFEQAVKVLSQKIDVVSSTARDPAALQQLEAAVTGLRGIVSHVASNEALAALRDEVRALAAKVDRIVAGRPDIDALSALEQRIASLTDVLEARTPAARSDAPQFEALMQSLTDKIERLALSRGDQTAFGHLEDRIVRLVEKLDASDARLSQLEVIERGLAELLIHLEELRASNGAALRAGAPAPPVDSLKRDLEALRETERRTQDSLEVMHGTLGHVVDRLAMLESDRRGPPVVPPPAAAAQTAQSPAAPGKSLAAVLQPMKAPPLAAERRPIDPSLPPDHPLEPGIARGRGSPADRIAASEAVLPSGKPPVIDDPGPKSNFIAAARRAAQAAAAAQREGTPEPIAGRADHDAPLTRRLASHAKSLLVGGSVIVVVLGAWQVASNFLDQGDAPAAQMPSIPAKDTAVKAPASSSSAPPAPVLGRQSGLVPVGDSIVGGAPASGIILPQEPARTASPVLPKPAEPKAPSDVTGSILPQAPSVALPAPPAPPATIQVASAAPQAIAPPRPIAALANPVTVPRGPDKLPVAIGGAALRNAATAGDAAAEYEIGSRYADGRGVPASLEEAARWYERAANQGLAPAEFRLGSLYEKGQGVKKDLDTARRLYVDAAGKGHAKAMHNLAVLYAEGIDGKPDFKMAAQWFRKAADRGVTDSQYNLGILYARGVGVEQNLAESYKWFSLALAQGDKDAGKKRDDVAARLDQQSLTAAKLAVQTFTPEPQPDEATIVKTPPGGWDSAALESAKARHK